jgi:hypothetical protein
MSMRNKDLVTRITAPSDLCHANVFEESMLEVPSASALALSSLTLTPFMVLRS